MRPFGSATELENRRRLAVTRVLDGYSQAEVARFLGVNVRTVRPCVADYRRDGDTGLATKAPLARISTQGKPTNKIPHTQQDSILRCCVSF
jgi:transposase